MRRIDGLLMAGLPGVVCAVKWGAPFYGIPGQGWIASLNSFKAHVKLLFFVGDRLQPVPPAGQGEHMRAIDYRSPDEFDAAQVKAWVRQAAKLPGWGKVP